MRRLVRLACAGLLMALAARCVERGPMDPRAETALGEIHGTVLVDGAPLGGANVTLTGPGTSWVAVSDAGGGFAFRGLPSGEYTVRASHAGVQCETTMARMQAGDTVTASIGCEAAPGPVAIALSGIVSVAGAPLGGPLVRAGGYTDASVPVERSVMADPAGLYAFSALTLIPGTYDVTAEAAGFVCTTATVSVRAKTTARADLTCAAEVPLPPPPPPATEPAGRIAFERNGRILILELEEMLLSTFIDGLAPAWSPNGERLAFQRSRCLDHSLPPHSDCDDIWTVEADGRGLSAITDYEWVIDSDPSWSPDGSKVAYFRWVHGVDDSYIVISDVDPPSPLWSEIVVSGWWPLSRPTWSPDGAWIAFGCHGPRPGWQSDLCIVPSDADQGWTFHPVTAHPKITTGLWVDADPAWSPDGEWIAFTTDRPGDGATRIAIVRPDGMNLRTLVPGRDPAWSPDGSRLVFVGPPEQPGLWRVNADGSELVQLTADPADDSPSWGP